MDEIVNIPRRYGLIGDPISTSRSPMIFTAAYGGQLPYDLVEGGDFAASWEKFMLRYGAVNVTAPFKEEAFAKVAAMAVRPEGGWSGAVSGPCLKTRAANLIVKSTDEEGRGVIEAHNSDFTGIILSVAEAYFPGVVAQCYEAFGHQRGHVKVHQFVRQNIDELFGRRPQALVVGCGGAGRAAAVAAAEMGFATALMNRTPERASALAAELPEYGFIPVPISDFRGALRECDLVIYTLPLALDEIASLESEDFAGEDSRVPKVLLEANYKNPSFGGEVASKTGPCRYVGGNQWLLYQALTGYGLMTGEQPDFAAMEEVLRP